MQSMRYQLVFLVALVFLAAGTVDAEAAERTKTGTVTSVDQRDKSFNLKFRERLETVEKRFEGKNVANFGDIKKGAKLTVTYNDESFLVSRVFSFGLAEPDSTAGAGEQKTEPSAANKDADIIGKCKTAKEVVIAYEAALRSLTLDAKERERIQGELSRWRSAASQNLLRVGAEWLPAEKAAAIRSRAESMIQEAVELLLVNNDRLAMKILTEATALDPDSNRAGFMAGWVSAQCDDDAAAAKHFRECAKRTPENVSVLNNLAVVEVRMKKFKEAVDHWVQAAALDPKDAGVAQNLGRFVADANARAFGSAPAKSIEDASRTYVRMIAQNPELRADPDHPWVFYLPPSVNRRKSGGSDGPFDDAGSMIGQGSGFVVAPGYILTNRHVAENAKGFYVLDPKNPKSRYPAETVAIIPEPGPDLAILRCPGLVAPALPIRGSELPRVASEVMATGFPQATELGTQAKSTVGRIIALPDPQLEGVLLYDAGTDGGNSGGPVCDKFGDVVAVHAMGFKFKIDANGGVPIGEAIPFLEKNIKEFQLATHRRTTKDWPDVAEAQRRSTVLICILDEPVAMPRIELARADSKPKVGDVQSTSGKQPAPAPLGGKPIAAASTNSKVIHRLDADGKNKNVERILPENRREFFTEAEIEAAIAGEGYRWAK